MYGKNAVNCTWIVHSRRSKSQKTIDASWPQWLPFWLYVAEGEGPFFKLEMAAKDFVTRVPHYTNALYMRFLHHHTVVTYRLSVGLLGQFSSL